MGIKFLAVSHSVFLSYFFSLPPSFSLSRKEPSSVILVGFSDGCIRAYSKV